MNRTALALLTVIALPLMVLSAEQKPKAADFQYPISDCVGGLENIDWHTAYHYHVTDEYKGLPRVFVVGDSIISQCNKVWHPHFEKKVNVSYWVTSRIITNRNYWKHLKLHLTEAPNVKLVYFHNGLHSQSVPPAEFEKWYRETLEMIERTVPGAKIVLVTTTPVSNEGTNRKTAVHNDIVRRIAKEKGYEVDDLRAFVETMPKDDLWIDGVHFKPPAVEAMSKHVADNVKRMLDVREGE